MALTGEPVPSLILCGKITKSNSNQVLGIQANLWTETIADNQRLDYMLFPRIAGLAEAAIAAKSDA